MGAIKILYWNYTFNHPIAWPSTSPEERAKFMCLVDCRGKWLHCNNWTIPICRIHFIWLGGIRDNLVGYTGYRTIFDGCREVTLEHLSCLSNPSNTRSKCASIKCKWRDFPYPSIDSIATTIRGVSIWPYACNHNRATGKQPLTWLGK